MNAMERGTAVHKLFEMKTANRNGDIFATTSYEVKGALWRCHGGITHIIDRWCVMTYDQLTVCGMPVRYRKYSWLYEMLGLAPVHSNCITCVSTPPWELRPYQAQTLTGRMSSRVPNLQPMPPRTTVR